MPNHAGSWLYFPETDDLYMGATHFSIMEKADLSPVVQQIYKDDEDGYSTFEHWPPYIAGQIDHDGNAQVETDWTSLEESALDER